MYFLNIYISQSLFMKTTFWHKIKVFFHLYTLYSISCTIIIVILVHYLTTNTYFTLVVTSLT